MLNNTVVETSIKNSLNTYNTIGYNTNNPGHLDVVVSELFNHIKSNIEIKFSWTASDTNGSSDPITSFTSTIDGELPDSLFGSNNLNGLLSKLENWFKSLVIKHPEGFDVSEVSLENILNISIIQTNDVDSALNSCLITPFFDWIKSCVSPSLLGSHSFYSGVAELEEIL